MGEYKKIVLRLGGIFAAFLLVLTFFSNTLFTLRLASVSVVVPAQGVIAHHATGYGTVELRAEQTVFAPEAGRVVLYVNERDAVKKGNLLFTIEQDTETLQAQIGQLALALAQNGISREQAAYSQSRLQADLAAAQTQQERNGLNAQIKGLQFQLDSLQLYAADMEASVTALQAQLTRRNNVFAAADGVVLGLSAEDGAAVGKNQPVMRVGAINRDYRVKVMLPRAFDFITPEYAVKLHVQSKGVYNISGTVQEVTVQGEQLEIVIHFRAEGLLGGELASLNIEKVSDLYECVVPNSAVHQAANGNYVYAVDERKTLFGHDFMLREIKVEIREADDRNTAILLYSRDPVTLLLNSDRPVRESERVRIVDGDELGGIR